VAQRVSSAWVEAMPEEVRSAAGPMIAMLGQMGALSFGLPGRAPGLVPPSDRSSSNVITPSTLFKQTVYT
jgi:uncharacterized protein (DUF2342 family)